MKVVQISIVEHIILFSHYGGHAYVQDLVKGVYIMPRT
jgi:hypothetical protein